jgi:hypothetical protein
MHEACAGFAVLPVHVHQRGEVGHGVQLPQGAGGGQGAVEGDVARGDAVRMALVDAAVAVALVQRHPGRMQPGEGGLALLVQGFEVPAAHRAQVAAAAMGGVGGDLRHAGDAHRAAGQADLQRPGGVGGGDGAIHHGAQGPGGVHAFEQRLRHGELAGGLAGVLGHFLRAGRADLDMRHGRLPVLATA